MQGSKLLSLLKSLSTEEFQKFSKFVRSPYYTSSKDVIRLFDYIKKYHSRLDSAKLKKEEVFKKMFPKEVYKDIKLRNLMRKLTHIVEEYLLHLEVNANEYERKKRLVEIYNQRNLFVLFEKGSTRLLSELEEQPYRDSIYFNEKFNLLYAYYFHPTTDKLRKKGKTLIAEMEKSLERYFALEQIQITSIIKNRLLLLNEKSETKNIDQKKADFSNNLIFDLVSMLNQLYDSKDAGLYIRLKEKYLNNFDCIRKKDHLFLFYSLLNYVIRQVPYQEINSVKEVFNWYQFGIEKAVLIPNKQINSTTFMNVVLAGAKLKKFNWVRQFISEYEMFLEENTREDTKMLALSFWHFHKGEYDSSIDLLLEHKFSESIHQTPAKTLLIKTYYELFSNNNSYYSLVEDSCSAFEMYIRRNSKIGEQRSKSYLNFIQFTRKLLKAKNSFDPLNKNKTLEIQLTELKPIMHRSWLKAKITTIA